jgi:hypothetical protein
MSESAPEKSGGGGGNVFTRKVGPLPLWAWLAIATVAAIMYAMYSKNKKAAASSTSTAAAGQAAGGVDSSLVPQFVNQTYVNNSPPAAPTATSTGTPTGPAYGLAGPPNANYQAITPQEAGILESNNNVANPSGKKAQRPFVWNGSAYVPNTNPINNTTQYYSGPLETQELTTAINKGIITSTGAPKSS